ncbi:hypothetical protein HHE06_05730 [Helicobacter heilmannii]|nr:hypothetical protein BN341_2450 [Helicobacter heilmannii ASB1.4]CRF49574.1 hypothetical protein HHE03_11980 [Helicobacter heilmannii]CRF50728.1 hypothetical protein HHE06_05730 [Helicobacter heilmannii]
MRNTDAHISMATKNLDCSQEPLGRIKVRRICSLRRCQWRA